MDVVTGAFSYTGRWIADRLVRSGKEVVTLSRSPAPPGSPIASHPLQFDRPDDLTDAMRGADTLYNTYWIRFERGTTTFDRAVANTRVLFQAAQRAEVRRIVHLSVTNADASSPLPYFRGKGQLEDDLAASGASFAVVRPTLVFGPEDILINNIAWGLRRFPVFLIPGSGAYRVQPVSVEDVARIAVDAGEADDDVVVDAAGRDVFSFEELVRLIAAKLGVRGRFWHTPADVALAAGRVVGAFRRDVILTREELAGLMASLLTSTKEPQGSDRFGDWLEANRDVLGRAYVSELARNFRPYAPL